MANLVACQMVSTPNVEQNIAAVEQLVAQQEKGSLVVLPECFACFGSGDARLLEIREKRNDGPIQRRISAIAKQYGVYIVAGSMPLEADDPKKYTASSLLFNDHGELLSEYQKIHLFDVTVEDATGNYQESRYTQAGNQLVVVETPFGRLGMAVCYDVRFAGMFQAMEQLDVIVLPSAFTQRTGEAHWHSLLSARAIEKQCYLVAANQGGVHANGRETFGHSCIYSPWGVRLAEIEKGQGAVSATLEFSELAKVRESMPVHQHNQFRSYLV